MYSECTDSNVSLLQKKNSFSYNQEKLRRLLSKKYYLCKSQAQKKKKTENFSSDLDG